MRTFIWRIFDFVAVAFICACLGLALSLAFQFDLFQRHLTLDHAAIQPLGERAYIANLSFPQTMLLLADKAGEGSRSTLRLFENGKELGPRHSLHAVIFTTGSGAYSHWGNDTGGQAILFSSSDNSDPRSNGRRYSALAPLFPATPLFVASLVAMASLTLLFTLRHSRGVLPRAFSALSRSRYWQAHLFVASLVGLVGVLTWLAVIRLGDWGANLASYYGDADNIAAYAAYHTHPERYALDPFGFFASKQIYASIMNWAPILLAAWSHLSVLDISFVVAVVQAASIGLAMMWFARVAIGGIALPLVASLLFVFTAAWNQNLASYGVALGVPYAGILVLSALLPAFAALLRGRNASAAFLLALAALVHPSFAVYGAAVMAFYFLFSARSIRALLLCGLTFLPCAVVILAVFAITQSGIEQSQLVAATILRLPNPHFNPTVSWPDLRDLGLSYLGWLVLGGVAATFGWRELHEPARRLAVATFTAAAVLLGASFLGFATSTLTIIQLVPHRATALMPIIFLPLITHFFWSTSRGSVVAKVAVIQLASLLILANWGFFWLPLVSLVLIRLVQGRSNRARLIAEASAALILLVFNGLAAHDWGLYQPWLAPGFRPGPSWHDGVPLESLRIAAFAAAVWYLLELAAKRLLATAGAGKLALASTALFAAALSPVAIYQERGKVGEAEAFTRSAATQDLLDAQRWAAAQSRSDAVFIVGSFPFRSMSARPVVHILPSFGYLYTKSAKSLDFDLRVIEFFGLTDEWNKSTNINNFLEIFVARRAAMTPDDVIRFAKLFSGNYYVQQKGDSPVLDLPVVHANSSYTIYMIP